MITNKSMSDQHVMCNYQKGESQGVELLKQLKTFAPSEEVAAEIAEQIEHEKRHDQLFAERLKDLDIDCRGMNDSLVGVYDLAQECVDAKDWVSSITIQAVIEELAMSTFSEHFGEQDPETQEILKGIIAEEVLHLEFGMRELTKITQAENADENRAKMRAIHLKVIQLLKDSFSDTSYSKTEHKILLKTAIKAYKNHKARLATIGVELPKINEALFAAA